MNEPRRHRQPMPVDPTLGRRPPPAASPQTAREQLGETGVIMVRWAIIGCVACFWIGVARNWDAISATLAGLL